MNWIVTADGHEASLEFPVHADYDIERIAHSLAQIVRFNGHACRPYSVAEHSLLGTQMRRIELRHSHLMSLQFGFHVALTMNHHELKLADLLALRVEREQLLPMTTPRGAPSTPWPVLSWMQEWPMQYDLMDAGRVNTTWQEWRDLFINAFQELQFARATLSHERLGVGFAAETN